jgi:hypothetical protein
MAQVGVPCQQPRAAVQANGILNGVQLAAWGPGLGAHMS